MKIYATIKSLKEYDVDDDILLRAIKQGFPEDKDIQNAETLKDISDLDELIFDIGPRLIEEYYSPIRVYRDSITAYTDCDMAEEDLEWGIH